MSKIKRVFGCIGITILIWLIARVVPSIIGIMFPDKIVVSMLSFVFFLVFGWWSVCSISKGQYNNCIRSNLYIFALIEVLGVASSFSSLMSDITSYWAGYRLNVYGVPYVDLFKLYGIVLLIQIMYIAICCALPKKMKDSTVEISEKEAVQIKDNPVVTDKNYEKKEELRRRIEKLKKDVKESDETYKTNKKILEEAYSDADLERMVSNGELTKDEALTYQDQRRGLEMIIAFLPSARKDIVKRIGDLTKELAELELE